MERYAEVLDRARAAHMRNEWSEAISLYDKCLVYAPDEPYLQFCMGCLFAQTGQFGLAIDFLKRVTAAKPELADAWHNLGIAYRTMGKIEDAVACYQRELAVPNLSQKDTATVYANWSGCYVNEGNPERVIELADYGLRFDPESPQLKNHKALALLEQGKYEEGFALYEARYRVAEFTARDFGKTPRWDGKAVGKLAIHGEQGIGDEILFLSQLDKVLPLADEIAIECTPRLLGLLRYSFRNVPKVRIFPTHEDMQKAFTPDAWLAIGSLPLHTLPVTATGGYLEPSRAYFRSERPRLGISWRGGTLRTHEYHRNAPFEYWLPLVQRIKGLGVDVISLQYGPAAEMAEKLCVPHDEENIKDLDMLAAMIRSCDLVLSVCNTTVHMTGALAVDCLCIVPNKPAWRYGLTGERSHWYESVRHLRQGKDEGWQSALARATKELEDWAKDAHYRGISAPQRAKA